MKQLSFLLFFCLCQCLSAQPKTEVRAVWLTVNYGLDWPKEPFQNERDIEIQKSELDWILDQLKEIHINMVFLQTRIRGDVIYPSKIEVRSGYVKSTNATADYDPLLYAIKACHQRGMECHAWIVLYPLGSEAKNKKLNRTFPARLVKTYKNDMYLDPGNPQTDAYLLSIIKEIVLDYDIDGIHLDYNRYPDDPTGFPDQDTYQLHGNGKNKDDWRRGNINRVVYAIYDAVKAIKPWVQVSSSVVGMYRGISDTKQGFWTAYSSVFQDPVDWLAKGKHDFIVPMTYYPDKIFNPSVKDWMSRNNDRFIIPGLGVFRMEEKTSRLDASVFYDQITFSRENDAHGNAFFRTAHLLDNANGFGKGLRSLLYPAPALLPPLTWLSQTLPDVPSSFSAHTDGSFLYLNWNKVHTKDNQPVYYNLYRSKTFPVNTGNPQNLVAVRLTDNQFKLSIDNRIESGYYYIVTGFDRYHNESAGSKPVYFVTGNFKK